MIVVWGWIQLPCLRWIKRSKAFIWNLLLDLTSLGSAMPVKLKAEPWGFPWFSLSPVLFIGSIWKCFASHFGYGLLSKRRLFQDGRAPTSTCPQELSWQESWDWGQPQKLVLFLFQSPRVASCLELWEIFLSWGMKTWCLTFSSCWNTSYCYSQAALCSGPRHSLSVSSEAVINTRLCIYILKINCGSCPEVKHLAKL